SNNQFRPPPKELPLDLYPGRYLLLVNGDGDKASLAAAQEIDTRTAGDGVVRVTLAPAPILHWVVDAEDEPIEAELRTAAAHSIGGRRLQRGRYAFDRHYPAGDYVLIKYGADGQTTSQSIRLGPGDATVRIP